MKTRIPTLLTLALGASLSLAACARPGTDDDANAMEADTTQMAAADTTEMHNTLTPAEEAEGWQLLFDGQDLHQWRKFHGEAIPAGWRVENGTIHYDPSAGDGGDIITRDQFGDFELALEWKISEGGNSGIMYRVSEQDTATWHSGPEMQVLDNTRHPDGKNPLTSAGADYAIYPPTEDVTKPVGEWNAVRIVVDGNHVEHWLNGVKVVQYELGSDDWKQRVADSKFAVRPDYGQMDTGHIALQDHGNDVWYRDVKVRRLRAGGMEGG